MKNKKNIPYVLLLVFVCLLAPQSVSAHATPITYTPASSATVTTTPADVLIHFTERIEPAASSITVFGPDGEEAQRGNAVVDESNTRFFGVPIDDKGNGQYTVSWQVVSADDGHFTKGAFAFLVDPEGKEFIGSAIGQIQIQHLTTLPEAIFGLINLLGESLMIGGLVLLLFVWRPLVKSSRGDVFASHTHTVARRALSLVAIGAFLAIFGTVAYIIIKTLDLQQLRGTDFGTTLRVFLEGNAGTYAGIRLGLTILFLFCLTFSRNMFEQNKMRIAGTVLFIILACILFAQSAVSHAAASHLLPFIAVLVTAVHLFFKELLVGGVLTMLVVLVPFQKQCGHNVLFGFISYSKVASVAILFGGITGAYITWLHVKNFENIFTTEWGERFLLLLFFAAVFFATRLFHQLYLEPKTLRTEPQKISWFRSTYLFEGLLGIVILFFSGYLSITTPPFVVEAFSYEEHTIEEDVLLTFRPHPFESDMFLITATEPESHEPVELTDIIVTLTNAERNIGPIVADMEKRFRGGYVFNQDTLLPSGNWDVRVVAQRDNVYDSILSFPVRYPDDVAESRADPERHPFGAFGVASLAGAILIMVYALALYRRSDVLLRAQTNIFPVSTSEIRPASVRVRIVPYAGIILIIILSFIAFEYGVKSDFRRTCEADGHFWLQGAAMRNGNTISPNTVTGCTLSVGLYHFASKAEYDYFFEGADTLQTTGNLVFEPEEPVVGEETRMTVTLSEVEQSRLGEPLQDLIIAHDRIIHMLIIGEDVETFAHIHTEDVGPITDDVRESATFPFTHVFPKAGRYTILVDYVVKGLELQEQFFVHVSGEPSMETFIPDFTHEKTFGEYDVSLTVPTRVRAGEEVKLTYDISRDGEKITDLEPYLAASMHLVIIRSDLSRSFHTHGEVYLPGSATFQNLIRRYIDYHSHFVPAEFGPKVQARITFDNPGIYQIFGEFKHRGTVVVTNFTVEVEPE